MLKQFAPNASTPPSPKNSAWIARATLTATTAAQGPRRIAMSTAPTACAVVPSGIGTLNIITKKLYAAPSASSGTERLVTTLRTRLPAVVHTGTIAAPITPHVWGDRYPSGMCNAVPPRLIRAMRVAISCPLIACARCSHLSGSLDLETAMVFNDETERSARVVIHAPVRNRRTNKCQRACRPNDSSEETLRMESIDRRRFLLQGGAAVAAAGVASAVPLSAANALNKGRGAHVTSMCPRARRSTSPSSPICATCVPERSRSSRGTTRWS